MATAQRSDNEGMTTRTPREHDVQLRLEFSAGCSSEQLEAYAALVQEAVDEHAGGIALGAVVGGVFDPPAIEVGFMVEARSQTELHHRVALVVGAIEPALPFWFETESATKAVRQSGELVPA
jgi:hypothetical protein